jgi:hypothetical protein
MFEIRIATLLHRRLGYARLLNGEAPEIVYLDEDGRLFSAPVSTMQQEPCASS